MLNKIFRWLLTIAGLILGYVLTSTIVKIEYVKHILNIKMTSVAGITIYIIGTLIVGLIFYIISPFILSLVWKVIDLLENGLQKVPTNEIIIGVIGLIIGLLIANLLVGSVASFLQTNSVLSAIGSVITLIVNIIFGTLGVNLAIKKKEELSNVFTFMKKFTKDKKQKMDLKPSQPKILDTSVIIDGRILDILKTGFVEGTIVIPQFVLEELRHIADSSDNLKRARGRRGLDILNEIQKELPVTVEICDKDFPNVSEVDSKLLKLAEVLGGKIITNDFNLNKVAEFQGVPVLNINELANAVKPVVIPGEEMNIHIIKDGKESGQGVAYLDDGTMIVVEGGKKHVGEVVDVIVTSVLQTAAGRMIFAKLKNTQDKAV
ncbi:PIN/TRAM domain-containing protein [Thermobrachium celere]|uniref:Pili retraction protein pilT n=1 Tax=Thermobrachium celere DSM 8682 TaxID=941824 RepID=R7RUB3_9CLOT|nr:PIN/TRAM domain-containing protein [Thermobrachium celere]GFR34922.1 twitching motility protein PilT [Thermobrachium celere]CDF58925.1 Pili retraction protein pilT [Thermobrachium celere DSM 8682]